MLCKRPSCILISEYRSYRPGPDYHERNGLFEVRQVQPRVQHGWKCPVFWRFGRKPREQHGGTAVQPWLKWSGNYCSSTGWQIQRMPAWAGGGVACGCLCTKTGDLFVVTAKVATQDDACKSGGERNERENNTKTSATVRREAGRSVFYMLYPAVY